MDDDTIEYCGENSKVEMNLIINALKDHIEVTLDKNDYIIPEELFTLIMNKTISIPILNISNTVHQAKVKNAIVNEIKTYKEAANLNDKDILIRKEIKGKKRRVICGIKLVNNSSEDSFMRRMKDNTQSNTQKIAEQMGVGCDYSHINDAKTITTDNYDAGVEY